MKNKILLAAFGVMALAMSTNAMAYWECVCYEENIVKTFDSEAAARGFEAGHGLQGHIVVCKEYENE